MRFSYKFTPSVLRRLELDGLEESPRKKLETLQGQSFASEEELWGAVMKTIGVTHADKFRGHLPYRSLHVHIFKVTERTLSNLEADGAPQRVLEALRAELLGQSVRGAGNFDKKLEELLDAEDLERFRECIVQHSRPPFLLPYYECLVEGEPYFVDVTLSTPSNHDPPGVLNLVLDHLRAWNANPETDDDQRVKTVCEVGAGRFRNVKALTGAGFDTYAVEYETRGVYDWLRGHPDDWPGTEEAVTAGVIKKLHRSVKKDHKLGSRFKGWVQPQTFARNRAGYHAIFLIMVPHVIPYPGDRNQLFRACARNLSGPGLLFWLSPWLNQHMNDRCDDVGVKFGPTKKGYLLSAQTRRAQTYYDEYRSAEMDELAARHGFEREKIFDAGKNFGRLYRVS